MLKRLMALLIVLALLLSSAAAEGTIAAYSMPEGAEMLYVTQAGDFFVPKGLEPMYQLMQTASPHGTVYLMRMKNGRALASVSCTPVESPRTAAQLKELWPQIARNIAAEAELVNDDPSCAVVETMFGRDVLHIRTQIAAGSHTVIPLEAEGFAFCRGSEMMEVWAVHPTEAVYHLDEAAAAELASDCRDLQSFLASLEFAIPEALAAGSAPYDDPEGRFSLVVPQSAVILTQSSAPEDIEAARSAFVQANPAGAGQVFDEFMSDVDEYNAMLLLTADMQGAIQISCIREAGFKGVTTEMLCGIAPSIQETLMERFGLALLLAAEDGGMMLSGRQQAALSYWLRTEECNLQLDVLACVIGEDWLCEVDVYTAGGEQTLREILLSLIAQTLVYTVE